MENKALIVALGLLFATAAVVEAGNERRCQQRRAEKTTEQVAREVEQDCDGDGYGC